MGGGASLTQIPEELLGSQSQLLADVRPELSAKLLRNQTDARHVLASLRRRSLSEEQGVAGLMGGKRRMSFSGIGKRRPSQSLPRISEFPSHVVELLSKAGIDDQVLVNGGGTSTLIAHIFDCLSALQYLIRSASDGMSSLYGEADETQSAIDMNSRSVGKLLHEIVTLYGLCGDTLRVLAHSEPNAAAIEDQFGRLPLHVAVDRDTPWLQTIRDLVGAYPEALECRDGSGRLPLHIAVDRQEPCLEVVRFLIGSNRETASSRRGVGRLPIHYAVFPDVPQLEVVRLLCEACPEGVSITDVYGRLPLHYAVDKNYPQIKVVNYLLSMYPEAAAVSDSYHRLPLSIASEYSSRSSAAIIKALYDAFPAAISRAGQNGKLPLFSAVDQSVPCQIVVSFLAKKFPEAILRPAMSSPASSDGTTTTIGAVGGGGGGGGGKRKDDTPLSMALANDKSSPTARSLLMVIPAHNPQLLRDLNWRARRIGLLLALHAPVLSSSGQTITGRESRSTSPSLQHAGAEPRHRGGESPISPISEYATSVIVTAEALDPATATATEHSPDATVSIPVAVVVLPIGSPSTYGSPLRRGGSGGASGSSNGNGNGNGNGSGGNTAESEFVAPYVVQLSVQHLLLSVGLQPQGSLSARSGRERSNSIQSLGGRSEAESTHLTGRDREKEKPINLYSMLYKADRDAFRLAVEFL